jgi:hypothetical protein
MYRLLGVPHTLKTHTLKDQSYRLGLASSPKVLTDSCRSDVVHPLVDAPLVLCAQRPQ